MNGISLVVCTLNRSSIIKEFQLQNLKLLDECDEMIIVDASDNDETSNVIQAAIQENTGRANLKYFRHPPGLPSQRNFGVSTASQPLVFFIDDDVTIASSSIAAVKKLFANDPDIDGITGWLVERHSPTVAHRAFTKVLSIVFGTSCFGESRLMASGLPIIPDGNLHEHRAEFMRGGFSVYQRKIFENGCRFNEEFEGYAYLEDTDFSHELMRRRYNLKYSPALKGFHEHLSSIARNHSNQRRSYVLNYKVICERYNIKPTNLVRCLTGILILNLVKSLQTRNSTYFSGTFGGCLEVLRRRLGRRQCTLATSDK